MKSLNSILLGVAALCGLALTSCSNQNETFEQISQKVESEYSILQEPETKGIYAPITGVGSYPYGSNITLGTDEGYTIMMRKDGSQDWTDAHSTSYTITDLSNNWWVRGEAASTITFKAGTGGKISTPTSIYGKIGGTATGPTATPDEGYNFAQWSDGTTNNPWVGTIPDPSSTITADFKAYAQLSISLTATRNEYNTEEVDYIFNTYTADKELLSYLNNGDLKILLDADLYKGTESFGVAYDYFAKTSNPYSLQLKGFSFTNRIYDKIVLNITVKDRNNRILKEYNVEDERPGGIPRFTLDYIYDEHSFSFNYSNNKYVVIFSNDKDYT